MTHFIKLPAISDSVYRQLNICEEQTKRLEASNAELLAACRATRAWFDKFEIERSITFEGAPELVGVLECAIANAEATP